MLPFRLNLLIVRIGGAVLERLEAAITRSGAVEGWSRTVVPRQVLVRQDDDAHDADMSFGLMLCLVATGKKVSDVLPDGFLGPGDLLLSVVDVPVVASFEGPYRSVTLEIDAAVVARVLERASLPTPSQDTPVTRLPTARAADEMIDAFCRWVELADHPLDVRALAPGLEEEIVYRTLVSPLGPSLAHAISSEQRHVILDIVAYVAANFHDPTLDGARLVSIAGVSSATLYRQFRIYTGMSPKGYIRLARLQRARQLMRQGDTAASAGAKVGYLSPSHFSRDYRLVYGMPPGRHRSSGRAADECSRKNAAVAPMTVSEENSSSS